LYTVEGAGRGKEGYDTHISARRSGIDPKRARLACNSRDCDRRVVPTFPVAAAKTLITRPQRLAAPRVVRKTVELK
jgi:hypothetical protein